jgi:hypothetical protein
MVRQGYIYSKERTMKKATMKKNYHKQPTLTMRFETAADRIRLDEYARKNKVSFAWVIKQALALFWQAVKKGKIKP